MVHVIKSNKEIGMVERIRDDLPPWLFRVLLGLGSFDVFQVCDGQHAVIAQGVGRRRGIAQQGAQCDPLVAKVPPCLSLTPNT
eukprot:1354487-Amphidinium_carterae.1